MNYTHSSTVNYFWATWQWNLLIIRMKNSATTSFNPAEYAGIFYIHLITSRFNVSDCSLTGEEGCPKTGWDYQPSSELAAQRGQGSSAESLAGAQGRYNSQSQLPDCKGNGDYSLGQSAEPRRGNLAVLPLRMSLPAAPGPLESRTGEAAALQVQNQPLSSFGIHHCWAGYKAQMYTPQTVGERSLILMWRELCSPLPGLFPLKQTEPQDSEWQERRA